MHTVVGQPKAEPLTHEQYMSEIASKPADLGNDRRLVSVKMPKTSVVPADIVAEICPRIGLTYLTHRAGGNPETFSDYASAWAHVTCGPSRLAEQDPAATSPENEPSATARTEPAGK